MFVVWRERCARIFRGVCKVPIQMAQDVYMNAEYLRENENFTFIILIYVILYEL
jgi:hypothetical protein